MDQEAEIPIKALVGLKEFDGHEELHSEFSGDDVFLLEESLLITYTSECVVSKKDGYLLKVKLFYKSFIVASEISNKFK